MKHKGLILILTICGLAFISIIYLSRSNKLSNQEVTELRKTYPYLSYSIASPAQADMLDENKGWAKSFDTILIAEVTGAWEEESHLYLPVTVSDIINIKQANNIKVGQKVYISFSGLIDLSKDIYKVGSRYIFFVNSSGSVKEYKGTTAMMSNSEYTFYITKDNYILSCSDMLAFDKYSGYSLKAFVAELIKLTKDVW